MSDTVEIRILTLAERADLREYAANDNSHDHHGEMPLPPALVLGTLAYVEMLEAEVRQLRQFKADAEAHDHQAKQSLQRR